MKFKLLFLAFFFLNFSQKKGLPKGFGDLKQEIPSIKIELRYATKHNFVGAFIAGYYANRGILTNEAIKALKKAQENLKKQHLSLIVYDAYRPQKAVNHFVKWAKTKNTLMKREFYPNVAKKDLFKKGYISSHSRHSSGSTIDLSIYDTKTNQPIDMGSPYDFFGEISSVNYPNLTQKQKKNRQLLQQVMLNNGFRNYSKEWWHFTLRYEPYRNTYFNFNVE